MRILISKLSSRGDILQALSVTKHLKKLAPKCTIDWIVEKPFCEVITEHQEISNALVVDTKKWRKSLFQKKTRQEIRKAFSKLRAKTYDVVFDLQGNTKSALFTFLAKSKNKVGFGKKSAREWTNPLVTNNRYDPPLVSIRADYVGMIYHFFNKPLPCVVKDEIIQYTPKKEDKQAIDALISTVKKDRTIYLICPQSAWENKCLSFETLVDFLQRIEKKHRPFFIFSWGSDKEKEKAQKLHSHFKHSKIAPKIDLCSLHYLMNRCSYVLAMDSICLHLAATTKAKTLSVFGPSKAFYYSPQDQQSYQGPCPYKMEFPKRCKLMRSCKTGACMKNIEGKELFDHFDLSDKKELVSTT